MIKCKNCGAENNAEAKFCSSCGAKISARGKHQKHAVHNEKVDNSTNRLTAKQIGFLVIGLVLIGAVILVSSGIFDSLDTIPVQETNNNVQQGNQTNPHSGVDMNQLQKINDLEKVVNANPNDYVSLLNFAHLLNDSGFKDKAIEKYNIYLKSNPKEADVWVDLGVCYYDTHKYDDAIRCMKEGIKIDTKHQIANFNLGIVYSAMGNIAEAKSWWQKAYDINPNAEIAKKAKDLIDNN